MEGRPLDFRILGPLDVRCDGRETPVLGGKQRALLAALLLRPGQVVSTDRLLDDLWGERPPPTAKASLQNAVSRLRRLLGPELLLTRPPGYVLAVEPEQVDVHRFERLVAEAAAETPGSRAEKLRESLALWRGPALADVAFEPFAAAETGRLEELRAAAREELVEAELALARHEAVIPELEALVAEQPFRERPRRQLMLALYRSGRQAEALEAYQEARRFLDEELGLEPGPALRELQQAILRQAPELDPPVHEPVAEAPSEERRQTVTVLFADLVDSTALAAELDPEVYASVLRSYYRTARSALERHGGSVEKFVGDAVMGLFGAPRRHEEDALRAVRAASDLLAGARRLNEELERAHGVELRVRVGVNTGAALVGSAEPGHPLATGYALNVAAKLEQSAAPGEALLGAETYRLVRGAVTAEPLAPLSPGGKAAPIPVFRLLSVAPDAVAIPRRLEAPLVGRTAELAQLRAAFAEARDAARCRAVTVVGEPGIGKSRLAAELAATLGDEATVLTGRCVSYGEGATYLPVAEIVRQLAPGGSEDELAALLGDDEHAGAIARRIRELTGAATTSAPAAEAPWAVRRLLETVARQHPVLLVLEDVHWAEPTLLDLVAYVGEHAAAPILLLCLARPDLLEVRPGWPVALRLDPLAEEDASTLVAELPGAGDLDGETRARIAALAGGNALYAEQLAAHVAETGEDALATVPPSLDGLLGGRLDLLPKPERLTLESASVLGRDFSAAAVGELSGLDAARPLDALVAKGLVREARPGAAAEDALAFHHVLVRDAAYAGITKRRRSELHERAAEWLDQRDAAPDEIVGYHLEQAYRYSAELGRAGGHARRLAEDAGNRLGGAGLRAFMRGDVSAAVNLLTRAAGLLPARKPQRRELLCELGIALRAAGDVEAAKRALREAVRTSASEGGRRLELRARIELACVEIYHDHRDPGELLTLAEQALPLFEAIGDDRSLARAWLLKSFVHGHFYCENEAWEEAAERALEQYRRTRWSPGTCLSQIAWALYFGPRPVKRALERCGRLLEQAAGDRAAEADLLLPTAGLEALAGRLDRARALARRSRSLFGELGRTLIVATSCAPIDGTIAMLAGDYPAAEHHFREGCEACQRMQEWAHLASIAAQLADALDAQGRIDEADRWTRVAEQHAAEGDVSAQFTWRSVRGKVLARLGAYAEAESLAREAVRIVAATDALNQHAHVLLDLAEVLRLDDRPGEAARVAAEAARLFKRKGNVVSARKARALAQPLHA